MVEEAKQSVSNPVMTVTNKNIQIRQGETFDPLNGVIATDYQGRKLTVTVTGTYDVEALGSYVLTYTATDAYGNTVTDTATLEVVKQNAPVINGVKSEVTIEVGQAFDPLENVTATDLRGGAALIGAGLKAKGITCVNNCEFVERGYENLEYKLKKLDVDIIKQRGLRFETEEKESSSE